MKSDWSQSEFICHRHWIHFTDADFAVHKKTTNAQKFSVALVVWPCVSHHVLLIFTAIRLKLSEFHLFVCICRSESIASNRQWQLFCHMWIAIHGQWHSYCHMWLFCVFLWIKFRCLLHVVMTHQKCTYIWFITFGHLCLIKGYCAVTLRHHKLSHNWKILNSVNNNFEQGQSYQ